MTRSSPCALVALRSVPAMMVVLLLLFPSASLAAAPEGDSAEGTLLGSVRPIATVESLPLAASSVTDDRGAAILRAPLPVLAALEVEHLELQGGTLPQERLVHSATTQDEPALEVHVDAQGTPLVGIKGKKVGAAALHLEASTFAQATGGTISGELEVPATLRIDAAVVQVLPPPIDSQWVYPAARWRTDLTLVSPGPLAEQLVDLIVPIEEGWEVREADSGPTSPPLSLCAGIALTWHPASGPQQELPFEMLGVASTREGRSLLVRTLLPQRSTDHIELSVYRGSVPLPGMQSDFGGGDFVLRPRIGLEAFAAADTSAGVGSAIGAPLDVAIAPDGYVAVTDAGRSQVRLYDSELVLRRVIGADGGSSYPTSFSKPQGIAFAAKGAAMAIADTGNGRVQLIDRQGELIGILDSTAGQSDALSFPTDVTIDGNGRVLASDPQRGAVFRFAPTSGPGERLLEGTDLGWPRAIAERQGDLFVLDEGSDSVSRYALAGVGGPDPFGPLHLATTFALAVGDATAALSSGGEEGVLLAQPQGGAPLRLDAPVLRHPRGMAFDDLGRLWVADSGRAQVVLFHRLTISTSPTLEEPVLESATLQLGTLEFLLSPSSTVSSEVPIPPTGILLDAGALSWELRWSGSTSPAGMNLVVSGPWLLPLGSCTACVDVGVDGENVLQMSVEIDPDLPLSHPPIALAIEGLALGVVGIHWPAELPLLAQSPLPCDSPVRVLRLLPLPNPWQPKQTLPLALTIDDGGNSSSAVVDDRGILTVDCDPTVGMTQRALTLRLVLAPLLPTGPLPEAALQRLLLGWPTPVPQVSIIAATEAEVTSRGALVVPASAVVEPDEAAANLQLSLEPSLPDLAWDGQNVTWLHPLPEVGQLELVAVVGAIEVRQALLLRWEIPPSRWEATVEPIGEVQAGSQLRARMLLLEDGTVVDRPLLLLDGPKGLLLLQDGTVLWNIPWDAPPLVTLTVDAALEQPLRATIAIEPLPVQVDLADDLASGLLQGDILGSTIHWSIPPTLISQVPLPAVRLQLDGGVWRSPATMGQSHGHGSAVASVGTGALEPGSHRVLWRVDFGPLRFERTHTFVIGTGPATIEPVAASVTLPLTSTTLVVALSFAIALSVAVRWRAARKAPFVATPSPTEAPPQARDPHPGEGGDLPTSDEEEGPSPAVGSAPQMVTSTVPTEPMPLPPPPPWWKGPPLPHVTAAQDVPLRCGLCFGLFKHEVDRWACPCGSLLHLSCSLRAGRCPSCKQAPLGPLPTKGGSATTGLPFLRASPPPPFVAAPSTEVTS